MLASQTTPVLLGNSVAVHTAVSALEVVTSAQNARGCVLTSAIVGVSPGGTSQVYMQNAAGTVTVNLLVHTVPAAAAVAEWRTLPFPLELPIGWRIFVLHSGVSGSIQLTYRLK
jgi:hypothetical protein